MEFSMKLKQARMQSGPTQEELAERAGLSQRSIAAYETQGVMARYSNIVKLAAVLHVAVEDLTNDKTQKSIPMKEMK